MNTSNDILDRFPDSVPQRIVSLVPSTTESLFALGFGSAVVGITDYCIHPAESLTALPKVGGPKNPRLNDLLALKPDLVIANREENQRETVEALEAAGIPVWVAFPQTVKESLDDLYTMSRLFHSDTALMIVQSLERSAEWAALANEDRAPLRYFCPIWQDHLETGEMWWMTFNDQTYSSDLLRLLGGENVFASRQRRYPFLADLGHAAAEDPGQRDTRYPRVTRQEIIAAQPDVIVLPSEPFLYTEQEASRLMQWFAATPAVQNGSVYLVDGTLITWCGTRLALALNDLAPMFGDSGT